MEHRLLKPENEPMNASDMEVQFWKMLQNAVLLTLKEQRILSETHYSAVREHLPILQGKSALNRGE